MTRSLEAGADAALQAEHVSQVVFLEFDFLSGVSRVCSREHSVSWNGFTWLGAGRVGSIEPIGEGGELEARGVAMTLSGLTPGLLATALTPAEYKGREVRIWFGQIEPEIIDFDFTQGTLTAAVGAALAEITFTRAAATATRVNEQGLIETVAADTPRFDYDPVTLACKGLLNETARINYVLRASEFDNAAWTKRNGHSVTADQAVAPDGTTTADLITAAAPAVNNQGVYIESAAAGNGLYAGSLYVKADAGVTSVRVVIKDRGSDTVRGTADITLTSQWQRLKDVLGTTAGGTTGFRFEFQALQAGTFFAWTAQCELGQETTSAILTTSAAVTRNGDVAVVSDISGFHNAAEGTLFVEATPLSGLAGTTRYVAALSNGTGNFRIGHVQVTAANMERFVVDGGVFQAGMTRSASLAAGVTFRSVLAYKADDFAANIDGDATITDTAGTVPAVDRLYMGGINGGSQFNGHLRRVVHVPKRRGNSVLVAASNDADPRSLAVGTRIAASPAGPFIFKMDQLTYQLGSTATLRLTAESRLVDWARPRVLRYNDADHQARHPGDKFFQYTENQVEVVHRW